MDLMILQDFLGIGYFVFHASDVDMCNGHFRFGNKCARCCCLSPGYPYFGYAFSMTAGSIGNPSCNILSWGIEQRTPAATWEVQAFGLHVHLFSNRY